MTPPPNSATINVGYSNKESRLQNFFKKEKGSVTKVSISSGQRNLMKTYHNEANTGGITKIALKIFLEFFGQSR